MKIFVSGGTGFVGGYLVSTLLKQNHFVKCLIRKEKAGAISNVPNLEFSIGDLSDVKFLHTALRDCDAVCHLAGSVFGKRWEDLYAVNSVGTKNIYLATKDTTVRIFIYLSSIAAVGPLRSNQSIYETCSPHPISLYGKSKLAGERFIQNLYSQVNVKAIILRPPLIYGKNLNSESRLLILAKKLKNGSFAFLNNQNNLVSLCNVEDLSTFISRLTNIHHADANISIINVCDDERIRFENLVKEICRIIGVSFPTKNVPVLLARIFASYFAFRNIVQEDTITQERISELCGCWNISNNKAKDYGYHASTSSKDGISRVLKDLIDNKTI